MSAPVVSLGDWMIDNGSKPLAEIVGGAESVLPKYSCSIGEPRRKYVN